MFVGRVVATLHTTKSCTCASVGFLKGVMSWSVDSEVCRENFCRKGSSNSSFATKSCACAYIGFLKGIISRSVDSEVFGQNAKPRYFK